MKQLKGEQAEVFREKGNELYKQDKIQEGIAECSKAIQLHPTNKIYYSNRVLMYLKSNQLEAALEDCQKIRELDPLSLYVKGHYLRGLVLFNLKKIKHAAAAFQTVMKLEPTFKQAKDRLTECLKMLKVEEEKEEAKTNEKRRSSEVMFCFLCFVCVFFAFGLFVCLIVCLFVCNLLLVCRVRCLICFPKTSIEIPSIFENKTCFLCKYACFVFRII